MIIKKKSDHLAIKFLFWSAVLGNEGVEFEARFALFCISGGLGEFGVEEGS